MGRPGPALLIAAVALAWALSAAGATDAHGDPPPGAGRRPRTVRISGRVTDAAGKPVAGVSVSAVSGWPVAYEAFQIPVRDVRGKIASQTLTDAKGFFRLPGVRADRPTSLVATHPDYPDAVRPVSVASVRSEVEAHITLRRGLTVRGMVVDSKGRGIEGAELLLGDARTWRQAHTDTAGRFVLTGVPPPRAGLKILIEHVSKRGFVRRSAEIAPAGAITGQWRIVLLSREESAVSGQVVFTDGTPAKDTSLTFHLRDQRGRRAGGNGVVRDERFSVPLGREGTPDRSEDLEGTFHGWAELEGPKRWGGAGPRWVAPVAGLIPGHKGLRLTFENRCRIRVNVKLASVLPKSMKLLVKCDHLGRPDGSAVMYHRVELGPEGGPVEFEHLGPGSYRVTVEAVAGRGSYYTVWERKVVLGPGAGQRVAEARFDLPVMRFGRAKATILGTAHLGPNAHSTVYLETAGSRSRDPLVASEIEFPAVPVGPARLRIEVRGFATKTVTGRIEEGKTTDFGRIGLERADAVGGRVTGRLLYDDGTPVTGARSLLHTPAGLPLDATPVAADGGFAVRLPAGKRTMTFELAGAAGWPRYVQADSDVLIVPVTVREGKTVTRDVVLSRKGLRDITVTWMGERDWLVLRVAVKLANGVFVRTFAREVRAPTIVEIGGLPAGRTTVALTAPAYGYYGYLDYPDDAHRPTVPFDPNVFGRLRVRVRSPSGESYPHLRSTMTPLALDGIGPARPAYLHDPAPLLTDFCVHVPHTGRGLWGPLPDGRRLLRHLGPGKYAVRAWAPSRSYQLSRPTIVEIEPGRTTDVDVRIPPPLQEREAPETAPSALQRIRPQTKAAVAALTKAAGDRNEYVRRSAVDALERIGPAAASARDALVGALADEHEVVRQSAVMALGRIGKAGTPALIKVLKHKETDMRYLAAVALGRQGPEADVLKRVKEALVKHKRFTLHLHLSQWYIEDGKPSVSLHGLLWLDTSRRAMAIAPPRHKAAYQVTHAEAVKMVDFLAARGVFKRSVAPSVKAWPHGTCILDVNGHKLAVSSDELPVILKGLRQNMSAPERPRLDKLIRSVTSYPKRYESQASPAGQKLALEILASLQPRLPKGWLLLKAREGTMAPAYWPRDRGYGLYMQFGPKRPKAKRFDPPTEWVGLWLMDREYLANKSIIGPEDTAKPARQIGVYHGYRVFASANAPGWPAWQKAVLAVLGLAPSTQPASKPAAAHVIPPGKVAVAVPVDRRFAPLGLLKPGARVNVVGIFRVGNRPPTAYRVIAGVPVLSVANRRLASGQTGGIVTVLVDPAVAPGLRNVLTHCTGSLRLELVRPGSRPRNAGKIHPDLADLAKVPAAEPIRRDAAAQIEKTEPLGVKVVRRMDPALARTVRAIRAAHPRGGMDKWRKLAALVQPGFEMPVVRSILLAQEYMGVVVLWDARHFTAIYSLDEETYVRMRGVGRGRDGHGQMVLLERPQVLKGRPFNLHAPDRPATVRPAIDPPLPGSRMPLLAALHAVNAIVVTEATTDAKAWRARLRNIDSFDQSFRALSTLLGKLRPGTVLPLTYSCFPRSRASWARAKPIVKGRKVIWVLRRSGEKYFATKALADTPANRQAVRTVVRQHGITGGWTDLGTQNVRRNYTRAGPPGVLLVGKGPAGNLGGYYEAALAGKVPAGTKYFIARMPGRAPFGGSFTTAAYARKGNTIRVLYQYTYRIVRPENLLRDPAYTLGAWEVLGRLPPLPPGKYNLHVDVEEHIGSGPWCLPAPKSAPRYFPPFRGKFTVKPAPAGSGTGE